MDKNEGKDDSRDSSEASSLGKFTGIAFQMIAVIGVLAYLGYKIDIGANHQVKWVTAALSLIGVFISLYIVIKSIKS